MCVCGGVEITTTALIHVLHSFYLGATLDSTLVAKFRVHVERGNDSRKSNDAT